MLQYVTQKRGKIMYIIENEKETEYRRKSWKAYRSILGLGDEIKESKYLLLKEKLFDYFVERYKIAFNDPSFDGSGMNLLATLEYNDKNEENMTLDEIEKFERSYEKNKHLLSLRVCTIPDSGEYILR